MGSIEKLVKALEALKLTEAVGDDGGAGGASSGVVGGILGVAAGKRKEGAGLSRREKVQHCQVIADSLNSPNIRNSPEFPKALSLSMEAFVMFCDDPDSNVRIAADECLNRTIMNLMDSNLGRLQVELYKEIKRNGRPRSLRAALSRFAEMCHLIRPLKCRPYIVNLLPCLQRIAARTEESVQETLGIAIGKIFPFLGAFTNEVEIKRMLKTFLPNLESTSAVTRRTAATSLTAICQFSRKPTVFYSWLLRTLLALVVPTINAHLLHSRLESQVETPDSPAAPSAPSPSETPRLLGVLLALRHLTTQIVACEKKRNAGGEDALKGGSFGVKSASLASAAKDAVAGSLTSGLLQVLEVSLHFVDFPDHNVVTQSLELLQQIFRSSLPQMLHVLVVEGGIQTSSFDTGSRFDVAASTNPQISTPSVGGHSRNGSSGGISLQAEDSGLIEDELCSVASEIEDSSTGDLAKDGAGSGASTPLRSRGASPTPFAEEDSFNKEAGDGSSSKDWNGNPSLDEQSVDSLDADKPDSSTHRSNFPRLHLDHLDDAADSADSRQFSEGVSPFGSLGNLSDSSRQHPASPGSAAPDEPVDGSIGAITDEDQAPVEFVARLLASKILLVGRRGGLRSDRDVRVSVKALALNCLSHAVALRPSVIGLDVFKEITDSSVDAAEPRQKISDVLSFARHHDPQLRGQLALVLGNLIRSGLSSGKGDWGISSAGLPPLSGGRGGAESLVGVLSRVLKDDSSVATRLCLVALRTCLPQLLRSFHSESAVDLLLRSLQLSRHPYWLVKVELLQLLSELDFSSLCHLEGAVPALSRGAHRFLGALRAQDRILEVVVDSTRDEDPRVRSAAATALIEMAATLYHPLSEEETPLLRVTEGLCARHFEPLTHDRLLPLPPLLHGTAFPYHAAATPFVAIVESNLSRLIPKLVQRLKSAASSRHAIAGACQALRLLAEIYPTPVYNVAWTLGVRFDGDIHEDEPTPSSRTQRGRGVVSGSWSNINWDRELFSQLGSRLTSGSGPLQFFLTLVRNTVVSLDLNVHQDALLLAGNLVAGTIYGSAKGGQGKSGEARKEEDGAEDADSSAASLDSETKWAVVADRNLVPLVEDLLTHVAKCLNVVVHVLEGATPGPPPAPPNRPSLPSMPNAPSISSPMKKRAAASKKDDAAAAVNVVETAPDKQNAEKGGKGGGEKGGKGGPVKPERQLGMFHQNSHYMKLYDVLKAAYSNCKLSLDSLHGKDKFNSFLSCVLKVLGQLLEVASLQEIGTHAEEMLDYLKTTLLSQPKRSVECVQQLLKALFGTNFASHSEQVLQAAAAFSEQSGSSKSRSTSPASFHSSVVANAVNSLSHRLRPKPETDSPSSRASPYSRNYCAWMQLRAVRKIPAILKPGSKVDKSAIASYIRLFEPLVIKSLKQYTVTSNAALQCQVLDLLAQLVQLRVNYCLLDSDQIFINFVLKQFEFVQEGQIPTGLLSSSANLVPHIFQFLVLLSYEKYHSKSIITMARVIQLCDELMASGQDPTTHAIPALQPIVNDLFVVRKTTKEEEARELDTQREYVVSMLFRIVTHPPVLEMLIVVVQQARAESEERWRRSSRLIIDNVLPLAQELVVGTRETLDVFHRLLESLHTSVFRPLDDLLRALSSPFARHGDFSETPRDASTSVLGAGGSDVGAGIGFGGVGIPGNNSRMIRWINLVLIVIRQLAQMEEEVVLARIKELALEISLGSYMMMVSVPDVADVACFDEPLASSSQVDVAKKEEAEKDEEKDDDDERFSSTDTDKTDSALPSLSLSFSVPEHALAAQLLQIIGTSIKELHLSAFARPPSAEDDDGDSDFLSHQIAHVLLHVIYMCEVGSFKHTVNALALIVRHKEEDVGLRGLMKLSRINDCFRDMASFYPILPSLWANLLTRLGWSDLELWGALTLTGGETIYRTPSPAGESCADVSAISRESRTHPHLEIVKKETVIVLCDFVNRFFDDAECATWLLVNHLDDLLDSYSTEPLVREFFHRLFANPTSANLVLRAFDSRFEAGEKKSSAATLNALKVLSAVPASESGTLLSILVTKFLSTHRAALARVCAKMATSRAEILLAQASSASESLRITAGDLRKLEEHMREKSLIKKHSHLWSLLVLLRKTLATDDEDDDSDADPAPPGWTFSGLAADPDASAFLSILKEICSGNATEGVAGAMLRHLGHHDIAELMMSREFELRYLTECFKASLGHSDRHLDGQWRVLFDATAEALSAHATNVARMYPSDSPPYSVLFNRERLSPEERDAKRATHELFRDANWTDALMHLADAMGVYLSRVSGVGGRRVHFAAVASDVVLCVVAALEFLFWSLQHNQPLTTEQIRSVLTAFSALCGVDKLTRVLEKRPALLHSSVLCLHQISSSLSVLPGESPAESESPCLDSEAARPSDAFLVCRRLSSLYEYTGRPDFRRRLPPSLATSLRTCILSLCRLRPLNAFVRVPPLLWKLGWNPFDDGRPFDASAIPSQLPLDFFQEKEVLLQHLSRINEFGWSSRQQFEETWMFLLSVLNAPAVEDVAEEDEMERTKISVMAVEAITTLLLHSTLTPVSGDPVHSAFEHKSRYRSLPSLENEADRRGVKLSKIRAVVERWLIDGERRRPAPTDEEDDESFADDSSRQSNSGFELGNLDRHGGVTRGYGLGQMSVESMWLLTGMLSDVSSAGEESSGGATGETTETTETTASSISEFAPPLSSTTTATTPTTSTLESSLDASSPVASLRSKSIPSQLQRSSMRNALDVHSCIQFLLELYSQWLLPPSGAPRTPLSFLREIVRSIAVLSDVFTERTQFDWMHEVLWELIRKHSSDDEMVMQYAVLGLCKSGAVIGLDPANGERLSKIVEVTLKGTHLPSKISSLYGVLYVLEAGDAEVSKLFVMTVLDYLVKYLGAVTAMTITSSQYILVMWSLALFIIEAFPALARGEPAGGGANNFVARVLSVAASHVSGSEEMTPWPIFRGLVRGLERLLLHDAEDDPAGVRLGREGRETLTLLSVEKSTFFASSPRRALAAIALMITSMYSDQSLQVFDDAADSAVTSSTPPSSIDESSSGVADSTESSSHGVGTPLNPAVPSHMQSSDPESLVAAMEKAALLFDRIRKGYADEANCLAAALPRFLRDFFLPQDVMNKLIGEFLSNQQPHPQLLARVIFGVFSALIAEGRASVVEDWVMLSLSNFVQRTPPTMAAWSMTCCFVAASANPWTRRLFPFVVDRMGLGEAVDKRLFVVSALSFHSGLAPADKDAFQRAFAERRDVSPFSELVASFDL